MKSIILVAVAFLSNAFAYHDPDLNYHLSQVQNVQGCGDSGYSYPAPAVQLKASAAPLIQTTLSSNAYKSSGGYSQNVLFQAAPKIAYQTPVAAYLPQPAPTYLPPEETYSPQNSLTYQAPQTFTDYTESQQQGYSTTAGLSSTSNTRTVIPQSTYAQAPIIAKVTAAPLQAKFAVVPSRTTYVSQNHIPQQSLYSSGSAAKASLNTITTGGPVVSQVYAAPSNGYAASNALKLQAQFAVPSFSSVSYNQASVAKVAAPVASQYITSSVSHSAPVVQYSAPAVTSYSSPAITSYSAPAVTTYSAPIKHYSAPVVTQYAAPALSSAKLVQYSTPVAQKAVSIATQYAAPTLTQYSAPVAQYSVPISQQSGHSVRYSAPLVQTSVSHVAAPAVAVAPVTRVSSGSHYAKNVHTDFLENYVSINMDSGT